MIQYPTKRKINPKKQASLTSPKRGMNLEDDLNKTNQYYLDLNLAVIHKKPTPITIVKVDYPSRAHSKITEAYFKIPSTTDYNGLYKGKYIDFEAKETQSKTSFALTNIHAHQLIHMQKTVEHGGISFLILRFTSLDETYLIFIEDLLDFVKMNSRKSLPYTWIKETAYLIPYTLTPPIHYLKILNETSLKGVQ